MMKYGRTLIVLLVMVLTIGGIVGGTLAWFTDSVEVEDNTLKSGKLKMKVEILKDGTWYDLEEHPEMKVCEYDRWEPGYMQMISFRLTNVGDLIFDYELDLVHGGPNEIKGENGECLSEVIDVYFSFGEKDPEEIDRQAMIEEGHTPVGAATNIQSRWMYLGTLAHVRDGQGVFNPMKGKVIAAQYAHQGPPVPPLHGLLEGTILMANGTGELMIQTGKVGNFVLHMREDAGNEYQGLSLGDLDFNFKAKQGMMPSFEEDAFGHTYDKDALWPNQIQNNNGN